MSFRSIVRDVRDGFGSLSRRGFEVRLTGHHRGKSHGSLHDLQEQPIIIQNSRWASLPPELLFDVIRRLEESESVWPSRKHVVACAAVCRSWRTMCKDIVKSPEFCGKLTFPVSLKQPGPRDGAIQCFIKRDKSNLTYHLFLCLSPALLVENGKFLLSAKRTRRTTCTEYVISMDADNISRSSSTYIGKLRSNFLGTKFIIYDTQPPYTSAHIPPPGRSSRRFYSKKVSPKVPTGSYNIAQVTYELNVLGTRGPRRMHCMMHSIPASALDAGGSVPGQPELLPRSLEDSFRSISFSKSLDHSVDFSSARFSEIGGPQYDDEDGKLRPLVLKNKPPRWHEQLQCWCLNFRGRVTVASVKNFQLIAATQPAAGAPTPSQPAPQEHDKIILQFGKVGKDMFTTYYFFPSGASALSLFLYIPTLHKEVEKSLKDLGDMLLDIPGLPPIRASDMPGSISDRTAEWYEYLLNTAAHMAKSNGIIVNTFDLLETKVVKAISDGLCVQDGPTPPIFCIGPLISSSNQDEDEHECLKWLNSQPSRSVVFLCFGSMGLFSAKQLEEMAVGLENSGQRFLWVVRNPPPNNEEEPNLDELLPKGFLERTKDRGFVVKQWAPQVEVLSHDSVGGFVTIHC